MSDIVSRKQAKNPDTDKEQLHQIILETAIDGFWLMDPRGRLLEVNDAYCRMSGYSAKELLAMSVSDLDAVEDRQDSAVYMQKVVIEGGNRFQSRHRRKDGSCFDVEISVQYQSSAGGVFVLFLRDISALALVQGALDERVKELVCIYSIASLIEKEENLDRILQGCADLMPNGWSYPEIAGARIAYQGRHYQTLNYRESEWRQSEGISVDGCPVGVIELCYLQERPRKYEGPFLKEERNLINKIAQRLGEVVARKNAEANLNNLVQDLAKMERVLAMGAIASSFAHELNQPLTGMLSNIQAAQMLLSVAKPDLDEVREIITDIIIDDKRAGDVIRQLRASLRSEEPNRTPVDIPRAISAVLPIIRSSVAVRNASITTHFDKELPKVLVDQLQLQHVVMKLVQNAGEAMLDNSEGNRNIVIRAQCESCPFVTVSIRDSGPGVADSKLTKMFEPLSTTNPDGIRLGLSVCRTIVEANGGRIWMENNPDRGATVYFTMPAVTASDAGDDCKSIPKRQRGTKQKRGSDV
ncbi:MAG: ATP-binding protein [bacterium]